MIEAMHWKSFVVLYEESDGLVRLQEVLKLSSVYNDLHITVRQLIPSPGDDYRYVWDTQGDEGIIFVHVYCKWGLLVCAKVMYCLSSIFNKVKKLLLGLKQNLHGKPLRFIRIWI